MDFRLVKTDGLSWASWYRGQPQARLPGGGKVVVQTPTCACGVQATGSGMYRINMRLDGRVQSHADFMQWVADIEDSASATPDLATWRGARSRSTTVYNSGMRLMAFSDTLAFDQDGKVSANLINAASCACIVELQGLWSSDARWGLRWKVAQLKFSPDPPVLPLAEAAEDEAPPPPGADAGAFAFLDD